MFRTQLRAITIAGLAVSLAACSDSTPSDKGSVSSVASAGTLMIRSDRANDAIILPEGISVAGILTDGSIVPTEYVISIVSDNPIVIEAWKEGQTRELHRIEHGGEMDGWALSINVASEGGAIAGTITRKDSDGSFVSTIYAISSEGEFILSSVDGMPFDVANNGTVVSSEKQIIDPSGNSVSLTLPESIVSAIPIAISDDARWIAGTAFIGSTDVNGVSRAIRWDRGKPELLAPPQGLKHSGLSGTRSLANSGAVVATASMFPFGSDAGVIWPADGSGASVIGPDLSPVVADAGGYIIAFDRSHDESPLVAIRGPSRIDLFDYTMNSPGALDCNLPLISSTGFITFVVRPKEQYSADWTTLYFRLPDGAD